jgi:signal transduction histidine kinase
LWSEEIYRIFGVQDGWFKPTYEEFLSFVHPDDRDSLQMAVNEAAYEKRPYAVDHRIVRPDGAVRIVHEEGEVVFDDSGRPLRMVGTVQDITELKEIEQELRTSEEQLRHLSSQLITAQEEERRRLSRELHDELGQSLSLMKMRVRYIRNKLRRDQDALVSEADDILQYIDAVIENVRRLSKDLSPSVLEDLGLTSGIKWQIANFTRNNEQIRVTHDIINIDGVIPRGMHINVYRIVQEALTNIERHADAKNVAINVSMDDEKVFFEIRDDGKGFEQVHEPSGEEKAGLGLTA